MSYDRYVVDKTHCVWPRSPDPSKAFHKLSAGVYHARFSPRMELHFDPIQIRSDEILSIEGDAASQIMDDITTFFKPETNARYQRHGYLYKRGILLHGKPGTGKSVAVYRVIQEAVANDMVVLLDPAPGIIPTALTAIRGIEQKNRQVLVVWEEFEAVVNRSECTLLSMMDGEHNLENIIYLATTNYLYQIPERIRNRPSRFANVVEIKPPPEAVRRIFFEKKFARVAAEEKEGINLDVWVKATEGMVIDNLKDLFMSVVVFNLDFLDAVNKLRAMAYLPLINSIEELLGQVETEQSKGTLKRRHSGILGELQQGIDELETLVHGIAKHVGVDPDEINVDENG